MSVDKINGIELPVNVLPVFIVAGQSNAAGRSGLLGAGEIKGETSRIPEEYRATQEDVYFVRGESFNNPTLVEWSKGYFIRSEFDGKAYSNQAFTDQEHSMGPEISFSYEIQKALNRPIGIIKHAVGGTPLSVSIQDTRGSWNVDYKVSNPLDKGQELYRVFKELVLKARSSWDIFAKQNNSKMLSVVILGMVWVQGETDQHNSKRANAYETNFRRFIRSVRQDISFGQEMPIHFVAVKVDRNSIRGDAVYINRVKHAIEKVIGEFENASCVDRDGIGLMPDNVHYSLTGHIEIGRRLAFKMQELLGLK